MHELRYCPDPEQDDEVDDGPGEETTGHHAALDASAKALRSLVMRFPEKSAGVLETNHFRWAKGVAPLRVAGCNELDTELATWTDKTTSAADSMLFSTLGCWVSPFTQPALALWGVGFAVQAVSFTSTATAGSLDMFPFAFVASVIQALHCLSASVALRFGRRQLAMKCIFWGESAYVLFQLLNAAFSICKCWGPFGKQHTLTTIPPSMLFSTTRGGTRLTECSKAFQTCHWRLSPPTRTVRSSWLSWHFPCCNYYLTPHTCLNTRVSGRKSVVLLGLPQPSAALPSSGAAAPTR
jgi:hypothetical protein